MLFNRKPKFPTDECGNPLYKPLLHRIAPTCAHLRAREYLERIQHAQHGAGERERLDPEWARANMPDFLRRAAYWRRYNMHMQLFGG